MKNLRLLIISLVLITPSCGLVKVFDNLDKVTGMLERNEGSGSKLLKNVADLSGKVKGISESLSERLKTADKDGDGKLSWTEIAALVTGTLSGGGILVRNHLSKKAKEKVKEEHNMALTDIRIELEKVKARAT